MVVVVLVLLFVVVCCCLCMFIVVVVVDYELICYLLLVFFSTADLSFPISPPQVPRGEGEWTDVQERARAAEQELIDNSQPLTEDEQVRPLATCVSFSFSLLSLSLSLFLSLSLSLSLSHTLTDFHQHNKRRLRRRGCNSRALPAGISAISTR